MNQTGSIQSTVEDVELVEAPQGDPCVRVIFGAAGDLTKRLLMPSLYNLACDGLLSENTAILGVALESLTDEAFRERLTGTMAQFNTRKSLDTEKWDSLRKRLHYMSGNFDDAATFKQM